MNSLNSRTTKCACLALCLVAGFVGCKPSERLETTYGKQSAPLGDGVNGTAVLGRMFEDAGHRVSRWNAMSPSLREADVIVWVPNDFDAPNDECQEWLTDWLEESPGRTLIYVGRDFDATPLYWMKAIPLAPPELTTEFKRRAKRTETDFALKRPTTLDLKQWYDRFRFDPAATPTTVASLRGPWAEDVDASKTEIVRHIQMRPIGRYESLLETGDGDAIVFRQDFGYNYNGNRNSQAIFIENGSWLLNLPLVNHEHRKLAGKLVASVGPAEQRVVFLESGEGGPPVTESDPTLEPPTGFELLGVWPIGILLTQLGVLGLVYAFARWPILGIPDSGDRESLTDFRKHIRAVGSMLRETGDRSFATATLIRYRQLVRGEAVSPARDNAESITPDDAATPADSSSTPPLTPPTPTA